LFSARKLQTIIPSVPSQASEPADDSNQGDEYGMADDSIIDRSATPVVTHKKQKSWVLLGKINLQAQV